MDQSVPGTVRADPSRGRPAQGSAGTIGAAGTVLVVRVLAAAAGLAYGVAVARIFGASLTGVLSIGLTAALAGKLLGELGVSTPMLRLAATAAAAGRWGTVAGVYRRGLAIAGVASIAVAAAFVVSADVLAGAVFSTPELAGVLRVLGCGVVPAVLLVVHASMLRAVHRPVTAALLESLGPYAIATGVLLAVGGRFGIGGAAWAVVAGQAAMLAVGTTAWRRARRPARPEPLAARDLIAGGMPVLMAMGAFLVIEWSDTIMLGILAEPADVGVYAAAYRVAALVAFVLHATNAVTAPHYAALHGRGDTAGMRRLAGTASLLMTVVALPVALALVAGGGRILAVFGPEFVAGATALAILAAAQLLNVAAGSVGTILTMTGHERRLRDVMVVAGAANIGLNALLIPFWGPAGAAVATAVSLIGINAGGMVVVRRRLGFSTLPARAHG